MSRSLCSSAPFVAPPRVHHVLDRPASVVPATDLGVGDYSLTTGLSGDEAGEALTTSLDEVEPLMLAEGAVPIGGTGDFERATEIAAMSASPILCLIST